MHQELAIPIDTRVEAKCKVALEVVVATVPVALAAVVVVATAPAENSCTRQPAASSQQASSSTTACQQADLKSKPCR